MTPPRIAVLSTSYPRSPDDEAAVFVARLVDAFSGNGMQGAVIVPHDGSEPLEEQQENFRILRYRYALFGRRRLAFGSGIIPNLKRRPWLVLQAPMLLLGMALRVRSIRADVDLYHANWIVSGFAAQAAGWLTGKPYVVTVRGEDLRLLHHPVLRIFFRIPLRGAAAVVSVNKAFLPLLRKEGKVRKPWLRFIPNGVAFIPPDASETERFAKAHGLPSGRRMLLFIGTLIPRKHIEFLIDLVAEGSGEEFELVICGRESDLAYKQELLARAKLLECQDRVHFQGAVSPADIPFYLSLAWAYVSASEHEGRPNALLEALAAGLPVVASDIPGHRELVQDGKNGKLFPVLSLEDARRCLEELAADPSHWAKYSDAARTSVRPLSWEASADQYRELFERVLERDSEGHRAPRKVIKS